MGSVAIAVPVFQSRLTRDEEISLRHLELVLGERPRFFITPAGLQPERAGFGVVRFDDEFFRSVATYSRLLLDPSFYRAFEDYEFLLIYQLDCLVFRDELDRFCDAGFDYVGAPWLADRERPSRGFSRVGNGGLCLRRVAACLKVLDESRRRPSLPRAFARLVSRGEPLSLRCRLRVSSEAARGIDWYRGNYSLNEDHFWCDRAAVFDPDFRIADVKTGLAFAFDEGPRMAYSQLGHLPMGCHGWVRHDRSFWQRYLLPESLEFDQPGHLA